MKTWKEPPLQVQNMEVCVIGQLVTSGRHGNVQSGGTDCWTRWDRIFGPLYSFMLTRKANTMSNSANIVLGLWIQRRWCYESGQQASTLCGLGVASLSIFGGNFVLAKVHRGLISVCWEVSASRRFSSMVKSIEGKWVNYPLYRGCLLFGGSVIRSFTVHI